MFLRRHVGEATSGEIKYDMATTMSGNPIIESKQTGQYYVIDWQDLIDLAVAAGIDEPLPVAADKARRGK